jgi:hypothetical protein
MAFMLDWTSDVRVGACFIQGAAKLYREPKSLTGLER